MKQKTLISTAIIWAPAVLLIALIFSLQWVKPGDYLFFLGFAVFMAAGVLSDVWRDRGLDEVEKAAARFGAQWGTLAGVSASIVLAFLPPFQTWLVNLDNWMFESENMVPSAVRMFVVGISFTVMLQTLAKSLMSAGWKFLKQ